MSQRGEKQRALPPLAPSSFPCSEALPACLPGGGGLLCRGGVFSSPQSRLQPRGERSGCATAALAPLTRPPDRLPHDLLQSPLTSASPRPGPLAVRTVSQSPRLRVSFCFAHRHRCAARCSPTSPPSSAGPFLSLVFYLYYRGCFCFVDIWNFALFIQIQTISFIFHVYFKNLFHGTYSYVSSSFSVSRFCKP
jgi:hypothetical protein